MRDYELEVLEQYDIEVRSTRKTRGAFFCDTNLGGVLLKEVRFSEARAPLLYQLCTQLEAYGYGRVDTPIPTKEGKYLSTFRDGTKYMLKKWYPGKECDVRKEEDVLESVRNLARLHTAMQWHIKKPPEEDTTSVPIMKPLIGRHLQEEYIRHNRELKKVREYIRSKVNKGDFELLYLKYFEMMYEVAVQATGRLKRSSYDDYYRRSVEEMRLVHGDYNYHNVLFTPVGMVTTGFEFFHMDVQAADLYYFLRKVMEKHHWEEHLGAAMLQEYDRIRPLSEEEREYLSIRLAYPEKFWKTTNAYYHSNKAWVPATNVRKLQTAITQTGEKKKFLEHIFSFHL